MKKSLITLLIIGSISYAYYHTKPKLNTSVLKYKNTEVFQVSFDVKCLKDFLSGEDSLGVWTLEDHIGEDGSFSTTLVNQDLQFNNGIATDNPCLQLSDYGCGRYLVRYTYDSKTCIGCKKYTEFYLNVNCGVGEGQCEKVSCSIQPVEGECAGNYIITGFSPNGPVTFDITLPDGTFLNGSGPSFQFSSPEGVIVAVVMDPLGCMPTCTYEAIESECDIAFSEAPIVICYEANLIIPPPTTTEQNVTYSYECLNDQNQIIYSGSTGTIQIINLLECVKCNLTAICENDCELMQQYDVCPKIISSKTECPI